MAFSFVIVLAFEPNVLSFDLTRSILDETRLKWIYRLLNFRPQQVIRKCLSALHLLSNQNPVLLIFIPTSEPFVEYIFL